MAAIADIAIDDGESTPVTHTFNPTGKDAQGFHTLKNFAEDTEAGRETMRLHQSRPSGAKKVTTSKIQLHLPRIVTETINGVNVDKVVDYEIWRIERLSAGSSPVQSSKNGRVMVADLLTDALIVDFLDNKKDFY